MIGDKVEKEYNNIINSSNLDKKISTHRGLKPALMQIFYESIGEEDYRIEINDDSITIIKEGDYPDATNGVYHGIKVASRCVIKLESDIDKEFLTVNMENVNVTGYKESRESQLFYHAHVTAYDEFGMEYGDGQYFTERTVDRYFKPIWMIYSYIGGKKPNFGIQFVTRNYLDVEYLQNDHDKWRFYTQTRIDQLLSYKRSVDHPGFGKIQCNEAYCRIHPYHFERLAGNTSEFAVRDNNSHWQSLDGKRLNSQELSELVDKNRVDLSEYLSSRRGL